MESDEGKEKSPSLGNGGKTGPKYALILIAILVVGLVCSGGVYLWRQQKVDNLKEVRDELKTKISNYEEKVEDLEKEVTFLKEELNKDKEQQEASIENWETYTNEDYNFKFQHPKGWLVFNELPPVGEKGTASQHLEVCDKSLPEDPCLKLHVNPAGFGFPVPDYEYSVSVQNNQVSIDKKEFVPPKEGVGPTNKDGDTIVLTQLETENNSFIFMFRQNQCGQEYRKVFDKMLKSFKIES